MPIVLSVNHERKEVEAVATGPIHYPEVEHLCTERYVGGLAYREFIDARGAGVLFTPAEVRQFVELLLRLGQESKLGPTAVLVSTDVAFGLMRLLEILVEDVAGLSAMNEKQEHGWQAIASANSEV